MAISRKARAMPLEELPASIRERIQAEVEAPKPPPKWRAIGSPGDRHPLAMIPSRGWFEWHWQRGIDPDRIRPRTPPGLRAAVIDRDGYVCQICGGDVEPGDVHLDHITPFSKGGPTTFGNLQVTHSRCNILKGARV